MLIEKTGRRGNLAMLPIGAALLALGLLMLAHPAWLPPPLAHL